MKNASGKTPDFYLLQVIKSKRKILKLTHADMAAKLGVTSDTYAYWESGHISMHKIVRVCEILNLKIIIIDKELLQ